ncbi:MAG: DNA methyltransferase [Candidatus Omnitrophota bacterium]
MININIKPEIKEIYLKNIFPNPANPRDITEEAMAGLQKSLEQFGYVDLLIVNKRNMQLIAGHQRLKIFKENGIKRVPCILVDINDMRQQTMAITLNNQQIVGFWTAALIPILEKIRQEIPDDYINLRIEALREEVEELEKESLGTGKTLPDDIPPIPKKAVTKAGDLWILGQHRILCGSSTNKDHVAHLMDGRKARLLATDPPYLVDYTGDDRPKSGKDWSDVYHEIDIPDAYIFYKDFLSIALKHINNNSAIYMWHASKRIDVIQKVFIELKILIHQIIIWVKPCAILTFSIYPWRHEPCIFGWLQGNKPKIKATANKTGTVWTIGLMRTGDPASPEYYTDIWEIDWEGKKRSPGKDHPTIKPTEVFAIPMRVHTNPGDICYEPFSGSGSQIIAAERLNRRCFAMEIEPIFVDVAVKRWEEFTGKKAKLEK